MTQAIPGSTRNRRLGLTLLAVFAVLAATLIGTGRLSGNAQAQTGTSQVTIVKQGLLGSDVASFSEDFTSGGGTFDLSADDSSKTFTDVAPGTYYVTEMPLEGYTLVGAGCALDAGRSALAPAEGNTLGITVAEGQKLTCTFVNGATQTAQATVAISKTVDGATPADGSFDFMATWTAANLNGVEGEASGSFTLDAGNGYMATTEAMDVGASYSVMETGIDATCDSGDAYRLLGYGIGDSPEAAAAAAPVATADFSDVQSNQYVVVRNESCEQAAQYDVTINKWVDDAAPVEGSFDFTSTWTAANLNGGVETSGDFTLDAGNSYMATTALMDAGSAYSVVENGIDATCDEGDAYRLAGYSMGATAEEAAAAAITPDASITDLQSDQYIVVHNVSCEVGNGSITIVKEGLSGDDVATFTHDLPGQDSDTFELSASNNSITFDALPAGAYHFTEADLEGYTLVSTGCAFTPPTLAPAAAGNTLEVILGADEDQTCTFVNQPISSDVTVTKYLDGDLAAEGSFAFTETNGDSSDTFELNAENSYVHSATVDFGDAYSIVETDIDGTCDEGDTYRLAGYTTGATLDEALAASPTDSLNLDTVDGDTFVIAWNQTCANIATITIAKDFNPDADESASFTSDVPGMDSFTVSEGSDQVLMNLNAGSYTFTEEDMDGWMLNSIFCSGQSSPSNISINLGGATAIVTVNAGDNITCTFTNIATDTGPDEDGSLTINKVWEGADGVDTTFTTSANLGATDDSFTLNASDSSVVFSDLADDTYTVTESAVDGWTLDSIVCTGQGADEDVTSDVATGELSVALSGQDVVCTFTNSADATPVNGSLTINKVWEGADGVDTVFTTSTNLGATDDTFTATVADSSEVFSDLAADTYTVTETGPEGWVLASIQCTGQGADEDVTSDVATGALSVALDGQDVVCTFTNMASPTGTGTITIVKAWSGADPVETTFTTSPNLQVAGNSFTLMDDGADGDTRVFTDLGVTQYNFAEMAMEGWELTNIFCSAPLDVEIDVAAGTLQVDLSDGEDITCTFTNTATPADTSAVSDSIPPFDSGLFPTANNGNLPSSNVSNGNLPSSNAPSTDTNLPGSNVTSPSTNNPTTGNTGNVPSSNIPSVNLPGQSPAGSVDNNSNVAGAVTAATPVAPSTGNGSTNGSTNSPMYLALGLAALAGIAGITVFGVTRKR